MDSAPDRISSQLRMSPSGARTALTIIRSLNLSASRRSTPKEVRWSRAPTASATSLYVLFAERPTARSLGDATLDAP